MSEGFNVKGYLTWSTFHQLRPPSITRLNKTENFHDKISYTLG